MAEIINPFLGHRVSGLWTPKHQAVDYATPIGFRFVAPADGVYYRMPSELARRPGQAGRWGRLVFDDGRSITFCHLNKHIAKHGQRVTGGRTVLAVTGNTGYVIPEPTRAQPWLGAHMHTYGLTAGGRRWNWTMAAQPAVVDPPKPLPTPKPQPEPAPEPEEDEEEDMYKPTIHRRTEGAAEWTLAHPLIGAELEQHTGPGTGGKRAARGGKVTVYRGFMVTADPEVGLAWARTHARGSGGETSRTDRAGYIAIQIEASRIAVELA